VSTTRLEGSQGGVQPLDNANRHVLPAQFLGRQEASVAAAEAGAAKTRSVPLPAEQVERRRRTALQLNLGRDAEALFAAAESEPGE
jgi:hypothetical protein